MVENMQKQNLSPIGAKLSQSIIGSGFLMQNKKFIGLQFILT
jgi:hypothetical protein